MFGRSRKRDGVAKKLDNVVFWDLVHSVCATPAGAQGNASISYINACIQHRVQRAIRLCVRERKEAEAGRRWH